MKTQNPEFKMEESQYDAIMARFDSEGNNSAQKLRPGDELLVINVQGRFKNGRENEAFLNSVIRAVEAMQEKGCKLYEIHLCLDKRRAADFMVHHIWTSEEEYKESLMSTRVQQLIRDSIAPESPYNGWIPSLWKMQNNAIGEPFDQRSFKAFTVTIYTRAKPGHHEEYGQMLFKAEQYARLEPGCVTYDLNVGRGDDNVFSFLIYSVFRNRTDYTHHLSQPYCIFSPSCLSMAEATPQVSTWRRADFPL